MNKTDVARFFSALGPKSSVWHFQTFDDAKKGNASLAKAFDGTLDVTTMGMLDAINMGGGGAFVAINEHQPRKARNKKTTTRIRAIFADFDDSTTAKKQVEDISAILEPSMVVESSEGKFHVYYIFSGPDLLPVSEFSHWQRKLVKDFGGDPKITDTSRVMRIPGYMHNKGEPFLTKIVKDSGIKYSLDDLIAAFYGGRNNYLTSVAGRYRRDALPVPEIHEKIDQLNSKLQVPLEDDEIELLCQSTGNYLPDPAKEESYNRNQTAQLLGLELDKQGKILPIGSNLRKMVNADKEASGVVRTNLMTRKPEIADSVPWPRNGTHGKEWTDTDTICWRHWLIDRYGPEFARSDVWDVWEELCRTHTYDPLKDYLNGLVWDGKERASTIFIRHLGAKDNDYSRLCAKNMLLGAVNRAIHPGCRHDEMVTFYGFEGLGKSAITRHLCPDPSWFCESMPEKLGEKDSLMQLDGSWFVEIAELKAIMGSSAEQTKAFLSATVDKYRPPYEKLARTFPRRCVFVGTTNNHHFLTENGQNRRFLPLEIEKEMVEKDIADERDQIWAEVMQWHKSGIQARPPREMWDTINDVRLEVTDDGEFSLDIIRYIDNNPDETTFMARNFYLETVEGASKERWVREGRLHRQISNAARIVFSSRPEWEYAKFRYEGLVVRAWRKKC